MSEMEEVLQVRSYLDQEDYTRIPQSLITEFGVECSIFVCKLIDWQKHLERTGKIEFNQSFYMEQELIERLTSLSDYKQRTALGILMESGIITYERRGVPPRYFYNINYKQVGNIIINSIKLQTSNSPRFKPPIHQGLKVGELDLYKDSYNKRVIKEKEISSNSFPSEKNISDIEPAQSAEKLDVSETPKLKNRVNKTIEFSHPYPSRYRKDVLDIINYWNLTPGIPHLKLPPTENGVFGQPSNSFKSVTDVINDILNGTYFAKIGMTDKNRVYSKEEILASIDRFKLMALNPRYYPRNKIIFRNVSLTSFFFSPYSQHIQSYFLKCLEEEPKQVSFPQQIKIEEENPQLTVWMMESYTAKILMGQTREFTPSEKIKFIIGSNLLSQTIKKLQTKLNMMTRPREWVDYVLDSLIAQWGKEKTYIGHLGSSYTYSETLIRYLRRKGRID